MAILLNLVKLSTGGSNFAETKAINVPLCYDTNPHNIPFALLRLCCLVAKAVDNLHVNDGTSGTVNI